MCVFVFVRNNLPIDLLVQESFSLNCKLQRDATSNFSSKVSIFHCRMTFRKIALLGVASTGKGGGGGGIQQEFG